MIVSMNVSHFVKICQVLTIFHQLICRGVVNFGTRCRQLLLLLFSLITYSDSQGNTMDSMPH